LRAATPPLATLIGAVNVFDASSTVTSSTPRPCANADRLPSSSWSPRAGAIDNGYRVTLIE
jgi:hypothetical protein